MLKYYENISTIKSRQRTRTKQKIKTELGAQLSVPSKKARNDAPLRGVKAKPRGFNRRLLTTALRLSGRNRYRAHNICIDPAIVSGHIYETGLSPG